MRQQLRKVLIFIALTLLIFNIGIKNSQKKLTENKELYAELIYLYNRTKKAYLQRVSEDVKNTPYKQVPFEIFSSKEDPYLVQVGIVKDITELAQKKGLKVEKIDFLSLVEGKTLVEVPIKLKASGPAKEILELLYDIETYFRKKGKFYRVVEIRITENKRELMLEYHFSVYVGKV